MTRVILASTSSSRLSVLRAAGLAPEVIPSNVDERAFSIEPPRELALALAQAKAAAVARQLQSGLVIGCDSLLEITSCAALAGMALGKPASAAQARALWRQIAGQTGTLLTGHCVIDAGSGTAVSEVGATEIRFANPSPAEIEAYISTREPLGAAGSFTLSGHGGWFVAEISGDYSNVLGISLPLLRRLLATLNVSITDLWS